MRGGQPIISVSGLRGIVGSELDPLVAIRYTAAFVAGLPPGPIVVTRDSRTTGPLLAAAVGSALAGLGRDVLDAGVAATPTTGVLVRQHRAAGGIQISASHNPPEYNGLKLFSGAGRVIDADQGETVLRHYRSGSPDWVAHAEVGRVARFDDTTAEHQRLVLATVNVARIRRRRFRILLDANHGAGAVLGRPLLEALGCEVMLIGGEPNGRFSHPAEPTEENLSGVRTRVTSADADVGFCQDPDADRLAVIDETGRYIGEEYTLALCLDHVLPQWPGPVVINCATSRMSEDLARRHNVPIFRSRVGEANVTAAMLAHDAVFGGEGNGGPIDPRVGYVRDSFVGMALILDALATREQPLGRWVDTLPRYAIRKTRCTVDPTQTAAALDAVASHFADAQADRLDGLRLDWPDKWLLVRASNTEPIVRIIAEARTSAEADRLCRDAADVIGVR